MALFTILVLGSVDRKKLTSQKKGRLLLTKKFPESLSNHFIVLERMVR